jgi:haloalkane dehalogenase
MMFPFFWDNHGGCDMTNVQDCQSHYVDVDGDIMHYLQCGDTGSPLVFLHGMPISSHTWRNIMPALAPYARCFAPDLIGMGLSAKPNIGYRVFDHLFYLETLFNCLDLRDITLVMHGWGSVLGFDYAMRHPGRVRGMVFYEAHPRPVLDWGRLSLPVQQLLSMVQLGEIDRDAVLHDNVFMDMLLPMASMGKLSEASLAHYHRVFATPESRRVLWQYIEDLPLPGWADDVVAMISEYSLWLRETNLPKLMVYSMPGFMTSMDTVVWCQQHLPYLDVLEIGESMHFAQETHPEVFRDGLLSWYLENIG